MKHPHIFHILLPLASAVAIVSCADDPLMDSSSIAGDTSYIRFSPLAVRTGDAATRSAEEKPLYDPLVLNSDTEDYPLYLHTYEHPLEDDTQAATRGVPVTIGNFREVHGSFGVSSINNSTGDTYGLEETTPIGSSENEFWTTTTARRWPGEERLNFSAIAPYSHCSELKDKIYDRNSISFSYKAQKGSVTYENRDAEVQPDLMLASSSLTREDAAKYNHHVPLRFNHALSAVRFAVRDVLAGRVVSVSIKGVYGSGNCMFTAKDDGTGGNFVWSDQSEITDYTQIFDERVSDGKPDTTDDSNDQELDSDTKGKTFMLIPQEIPDNAVIEVVIERDNDDLPQKRITVRGKIKNNMADPQWKAGHEYVYTISTSSDNWVYVFKATGNTENGNINDIYVWSPGKKEFKEHGNESYFNVVSYRYKANDPNTKEILPWTASHGGSPSYKIINGNDVKYDVQGFTLQASDWITDKHSTPLEGIGAIVKEDGKHELIFSPHFLATSWKGDSIMQSKNPYSGFSKTKPYDLSTFGGKRNRYTANCYIVDRGGWYCFPLIYGNAITDGTPNEKSYKCQSSATDINKLGTLVKHDGKAIAKPEIEGGTKATLIWQDAYNMIEDIELVTINSEQMIRFHIESMDLQQGNAIIALQNANGTILWSWHIWATEHWLNDSGLPHKFSGGNVTFNANDVTGIRERGDVSITYNQHGKTFKMSPYNLGWCDPKNVYYLKRKNVMEFVQYMPGETKLTGKTDRLQIIQDGETVEYRYGNNTYYQFGRKDPMVGFVDRNDHVKYNFGPYEYGMKDQGVTINDGIKNPQTLYVGLGTDTDANQDWLRNAGYSNLWNNHASISATSRESLDYHADLWCHTKTVYDPSPAGYMVPNAGIWHVVGSYEYKTGSYTSYWAGKQCTINQYKSKLHGQYVDDYMSKVWGGDNATDAEAIFMVSTGHRWYSDIWKPGGTIAGDNFGKTCSYAWSNHYTTGYNAYGVAIGNDGDSKYYLGGQFIGRRAMARPVRAIREP